MPLLRALAALLCAAASAFTAQDFFPMAVWYGGGKARAPMLEREPRARQEAWRNDLRAIKGAGFNSIRAWVDWASGEPEEGKYQFETLDVLLALAEQEGLKVVVQVYMDAAPDWVGRKFPQSHFVAASGDVMPSEASPGYCRDHPGVNHAEVAFFDALARRVTRSKSFFGWDLWSEPHVINWATANYLYHPEFCYCPSSVARFRAWVRKKYGSLDTLNTAWYRRFRTWDEVEPSRLSTILSYTDFIDWRTFIQAKLGEDLRARYEAVKRVAPDRVATSHAAGPSLFTSPLAGDGSPDDWIMARQVDHYGTSFYPKHSMPVGRDLEWRAALLDFARSSGYSGPRAANGGFWIGELQSGFGTVALNVSATVTPADLRIWMWSALARGAKAINVYAWYPMSTGYEAGGYGLIQLDGTVSERAKTAGAIARTVDRNQELFLNAHPPRAEVAIVFNPMSYFIGGRQRQATVAGPQSEVATIERDSMLGVHRALFPTNVPVDFIHINDLSGIGGYKLVILPYPLMLPRAAAVALQSYVAGGGALVAEARLAWMNDGGQASETIPGLGLHEVFGCREAAVQSVPGLRTELLWEDGARLPGRLYEETLEPLRNGRVAARFANGAPAAVEATYGKGKTLALGSYLAYGYQADRTPAVQAFFERLLAWANVPRSVEVTGGAEVRWLESGRSRLVFAFNHSAKPAQVTIRFPGAWTAYDLITGASVPALARIIDAEDVWILRLTPR